SKISVDTLSALSADIGDITAGNISGIKIKGSEIVSDGFKKEEDYPDRDYDYDTKVTINKGNVRLDAIPVDSNGKEITSGAGREHIELSDKIYIKNDDGLSNYGSNKVLLKDDVFKVVMSGKEIKLLNIANSTRERGGSIFVPDDPDRNILHI